MYGETHVLSMEKHVYSILDKKTDEKEKKETKKPTKQPTQNTHTPHNRHIRGRTPVWMPSLENWGGRKSILQAQLSLCTQSPNL